MNIILNKPYCVKSNAKHDTPVATMPEGNIFHKPDLKSEKWNGVAHSTVTEEHPEEKLRKYRYELWSGWNYS